MTETREPAPKASRSPLLLVLATIGGISIFTAFVFFLFVFMLMRSIGHGPEIIAGEAVGVVDIKGVIADPEPVIDALRQFREDKDVKAVVVRIDSPGGAVGASQEIYQEIRILDREKPVVASLASMAASGGFYAALGARRIVTNPGAVTGSIGVIMKLPNLGPLLEKLGVRTTVLKSGALKDLGPVTRDLSDEEKAVLEGVMNDIHAQFIGAVSESRHIPPESVALFADGRIFSGRQALDMGLVDELGNFGIAVTRAAEFAKIKGTPRLVYPALDHFRLFREFMGEEGASLLSEVARLVSSSPSPRPFSYEYVQ